MYGYLLNFYKYSPQGNDPNFINNLDHSFIRSIVWSPFDRLEIRKISEFEQFRQSEYGEKNWVGERQFSMIYDVSDNNYPQRLVYKNNCGKNKCEFTFANRKAPEKKYRFFGISMLDISQEFCHYIYSQENPGNEFRNQFLSAIDSIIKENSITSDLCYDVYCTLGGNDLVVIWLSNQFKDVITVIECLRKSRINNNTYVLTNASTIMGICDIEPDVDFSDVEGKLHIRLTKKDSFDFDTVSTALGEVLKKSDIQFETILGEHDLFFSIEGAELASNLYKDDGFIHIRNEQFFNNFIQASTEISVNIEYDKLVPYTFKFNVEYKKRNLDMQHTIDIRACIESIILAPVFTKAPYLQETLWILYEDYMKNISSVLSYPWIHDLKYYFESALIYLKNLTLPDNNIKNITKYNCVDIVVSSMKHMLLHVSQANRLFFEIPNTHLKHTGTYSKILRAYQGIIKQLVDLAYNIPKFSNCSLIVPAITFDITPITVSLSCPDIKTPDTQNKKIVTIKLPYEAFTDINKYAYLLAHEIYHYIPPKDRKTRNSLLGAIVINIIFTQIIMLYIQESIITELSKREIESDWNSVFHIIKNHLERYLLNNTLLHYDEISSNLFNINYDNLEWESYYKVLQESFKCGISKENIKRLFNLFYQFNFDALNILEINNLSESEKDLLNKAIAIINLQIDKGLQSFENWIVQYHSNNRLFSIDYDIQYAIRETLADFFMIQATGADKVTYLKLILEYTNIFSESNSITQDFRLVLGLKYVIEKDIFNPDIKNELEKELLGYGLLKEEIAHICSKCLEYRSVIELYDIIILKIFDGLNFNTIERDDLNGIFSQKKKDLKTLFSYAQANSKTKFEKNIYFVEHFQNQQEFDEIRIPKPLQSMYRENNVFRDILKQYNFDISKYKIDSRKEICKSLEDVLKCISKGVAELSKDEDITPIWFRGHSKTDYKLLPSLYRMRDNNSFYHTNLRDTVESLFKSFRVKSFGAPEIFEKGNDSIIGTLVSMQHYSVPTNILDWSTSVFVALYFAVEQQMAYTKSEINLREKCESDADLWLLNPIRLNMAREYLGTKIINQEKIKEMLCYPIPSMFGTELEYQEFLPFAKEECEKNEFPLAIYVPFVNPRIKAQVGTFTMFSLDVDAKETTNEKGEKLFTFSEYDLDVLQKKYKDKSGENYKPFLKRISISKECISEIADWLRKMGINKSTIYPDLSNISQSTTKEIKNYLERIN